MICIWVCYYLRDYDGFGNNKRLNQVYIIWCDISFDELICQGLMCSGV